MNRGNRIVSIVMNSRKGTEMKRLWLTVAVVVLMTLNTVPSIAAENASTLSMGSIPLKSGETVAFLGDSITAAGWMKKTGYVRLVQAGLKANGIEIQVIPAGIGGHKSDNMLNRIDKDVLSKKPDWMLLSCGVNDVWQGAKGIPLEQYKENMTAMVAKAFDAKVKVMLLTPTMIQEDAGNQNNKTLQGYVAFLHELAKEKGLLISDLNDAMWKELDRFPNRKGNILSSDGVHMLGSGNRVMAKGVLKAFGLNDNQIRKAVTEWDSISTSFRYDSKTDIPLTAVEELNLNYLTPEEKAKMDSQVQAAVSKIVERYAKAGERMKALPPGKTESEK